MERHRFRSTSFIDIQAELHEQELLREVSRRGVRPRRRATRFGLTVLGRRLIG